MMVEASKWHNSIKGFLLDVCGVLYVSNKSGGQAIDGIVSDFNTCDTANPNCVVIGEAGDEFTYQNMNAAFRILIDKKQNPLLISLGCGRFYQRDDGPWLDLGAYAMGLKYATDCKHVIIGKPQEDYFMSAINDMNLTKEDVVMIGDDINSDIAGAQKMGIKAIQVRTGKFRAEWELHPEIKPDMIADNLLHAVETILDDKN